MRRSSPFEAAGTSAPRPLWVHALKQPPTGCDYRPHRANDLQVHVTVEGKAIIMTLPGTTFCVPYRKTSENPWLMASDIRDDHTSGISRRTFRARAWTAANEKARELGWVV